MTLSTTIALEVGKAGLGWVKTYLSKAMDKRHKNMDEKELWNQIVSITLNQTKAMAERYSKITTVAFPNETVSLDSIYIPLTLEYSNGKKYNINTYPESLFHDERKILIIDPAGMGKSTISKFLYINSITNKKSFPVLVDLRRLTGDESINSSLIKQFGLLAKHADLFYEFIRTQPLLYIFDGFDEVADSNKVNVARRIRDFVDQSEQALFIITTRPEIHFSNYTDFKTFHISPLNKKEAHELITKYGAAFKIEDRAKNLIDDLQAKHSAAVSSFLRNPLLCSLLFRAFEYKSVIPVKRGVFYRQVFDALYDCHDLNKEAGYVRDKKTGLHHDDFHRALRATASLFRQKKVVEVTVQEFTDMAKSISTALCPDLAFSPTDFLSDVTTAVPMLTKDGNFIRWAHKSLMDYFLSEYLLRDYTQSKEDALRRVAFGPESLSSENFLTLVHEADPTLFSTSVTIPAIEELLERNNAIKKMLPANISKDASDDISIFYMGYEVLVSSKPMNPPEVTWSAYLKDAEETAGINASDYFPQVIFHIEKSHEKEGSMGLFMHKSLAALQVPIRNGGLPQISMHQITRSPSEDQAPSSPSAPEKSYSLLGSRFSSGDWSTVDEDFYEAVKNTSLSHFDMLSPSSLAKSKLELEKVVKASIKARSHDIF